MEINEYSMLLIILPYAISFYVFYLSAKVWSTAFTFLACMTMSVACVYYINGIPF